MKSYISRWKHKSPTHQLLGWLQGFAELVDGIVTLCSLGFYSSTFEISYSMWRSKWQIKQLKKERLIKS